jgi:hypothetical protein
MIAYVGNKMNKDIEAAAVVINDLLQGTNMCIISNDEEEHIIKNYYNVILYLIDEMSITRLYDDSFNMFDNREELYNYYFKGDKEVITYLKLALS